MISHLHRQLITYLESNEKSKFLMEKMKNKFVYGAITPRGAANEIFEEFIDVNK
jgi:hypothetical protein